MALALPKRDPRLLGYSAVALALATLGLLLAQGVLLAAASPFAVVALWGLRDRRSVDIDTVLSFETQTPLEGAVVRGSLIVRSDASWPVHVTVVLGAAWEAVHPHDLRWVIEPDRFGEPIDFEVRSRTWGRLTFGRIETDVVHPSGLIRWATTYDTGRWFRVLPPPIRVRELMPPPKAHALVGQHASSRVGDGFDFAEVRPFTPGDRQRDINWRATARSTDVQVNRRHPDRNGEVIMLLDTHWEGAGEHSDIHAAAVSRAAGAAWSITQLHLASFDRVGLASRGRISNSISPAGGDRARYALLEVLLDIAGAAADAASVGGPTRLRLPPNSLVITLTTLSSPMIVNTVLSLHRFGHRLAVVALDTTDLLPPPKDFETTIAYRLDAVERRTTMEVMQAHGVPIVRWGTDDSLSHVIGALRHRQHARTVRR